MIFFMKSVNLFEILIVFCLSVYSFLNVEGCCSNVFVVVLSLLVIDFVLLNDCSLGEYLLLRLLLIVWNVIKGMDVLWYIFVIRVVLRLVVFLLRCFWILWCFVWDCRIWDMDNRLFSLIFVDFLNVWGFVESFVLSGGLFLWRICWVIKMVFFLILMCNVEVKFVVSKKWGWWKEIRLVIVVEIVLLFILFVIFIVICLLCNMLIVFFSEI